VICAAIPLSDALANPNGLTPNDAALRFAGRTKVFLNRVWLHAWPGWLVAVSGGALLLVRSAQRDRLDFTVPMIMILFPITLIVCLVAARRFVISKGAQLCVIALPSEAVALLGVNYQRSSKDGGGTVPRHPLVASESGLGINLEATHDRWLSLRDQGISVELTASRTGLLSRCVLCRGDRRVPVRVRGRLRLKPHGARHTRADS
jgi:hypothetical protein